MTYCLGIKVNEGLVFASDSRTNAGLDNVGSYTKMFTYNVGDRAFVIMTAGNLATSQAVYHKIQKDLDAESPKINLNRLIDSLSPELIIWDGSNYKSDQERWKLSCKAKKIPFHQTSEKGAFIIDF